MDNLELWNAVATTDPKYTKQVSQRGGYTAIDPQYQLQLATALWGPYGDNWGLYMLEWSMIEIEGHKPSMVLDAVFYYTKNPEEPKQTDFPISADMVYRPGDDCRKKLLTSARSKALSMLGFNSDVFLGSFDDNHYVQAQASHFEAEADLKRRVIEKLRQASTQVEVVASRNKVNALYDGGSISKPLQSELLELVDRAERSIANSPAMSDAEKAEIIAAEGEA